MKRIMMMVPICIGVAFGLSSCYVEQFINWKEKMEPREKLGRDARVLLVSAVNPKKPGLSAKKARAVGQLSDHTLNHLKVMMSRDSVEAEVIRGYKVDIRRQDSSIRVLTGNGRFTHVLILTSLDVYFETGDVEFVDNSDGSQSRVTDLNTVAEIGYRFMRAGASPLDTLVTSRVYFGNRVGLLSMLTPSITKHMPDAYEAVEWNAEVWGRRFFPWYRNRTREVVGNARWNGNKTFLAMSQAIDRKDLERALSEARRQTSNSKRSVASMAYYNCAAICEALGRKQEMLDYLDKSIEANSLNMMARFMKGQYAAN